MAAGVVHCHQQKERRRRKKSILEFKFPFLFYMFDVAGNEMRSQHRSHTQEYGTIRGPGEPMPVSMLKQITKDARIVAYSACLATYGNEAPCVAVNAVDRFCGREGGCGVGEEADGRSITASNQRGVCVAREG